MQKKHATCYKNRAIWRGLFLQHKVRMISNSCTKHYPVAQNIAQLHKTLPSSTTLLSCNCNASNSSVPRQVPHIHKQPLYPFFYRPVLHGNLTWQFPFPEDGTSPWRPQDGRKTRAQEWRPILNSGRTCDTTGMSMPGFRPLWNCCHPRGHDSARGDWCPRQGENNRGHIGHVGSLSSVGVESGGRCGEREVGEGGDEVK